jgi:hypothetical protein
MTTMTTAKTVSHAAALCVLLLAYGQASHEFSGVRRAMQTLTTVASVEMVMPFWAQEAD